MLFGPTCPVLQPINKRVDDLLLGRRVGVVRRVWRDRGWKTVERFVRPVNTSRRDIWTCDSDGASRGGGASVEHRSEGRRWLSASESISRISTGTRVRKAYVCCVNDERYYCTSKSSTRTRRKK